MIAIKYDLYITLLLYFVRLVPQCSRYGIKCSIKRIIFSSVCTILYFQEIGGGVFINRLLTFKTITLNEIVILYILGNIKFKFMKDSELNVRKRVYFV